MLAGLALVGCDQKGNEAKHIKVGVINGAEQDVAEVAKKVAKEIIIILLIVSIMFAIYTFMNNITSYYLITVIIINIIVFFCIKLSCTKFAIYDNYVVVKNNYGEFNEIQSLLLEKKDKENTYELKLTTKYDLLICSIMTENPKDILKSIKTNLPKNIKIKELSAK